MLLQALRMTARDWRAGELRFLMLSLIVAVAALSSVGFFVDRMRAGLQRDAHQLLGGDLVINADQPVAPAWRAEAARLGLTAADTVAFPSMALAGEGAQAVSQLVSVKAVSPGYPLRGRVTVAQQPDGPASAAEDIPRPGTVWVDAGLLTGLNARVGDSLQLGERRFTIGRVIVVEPDRGAAFMNFAPRVLLPLSDLAGDRPGAGRLACDVPLAGGRCAGAGQGLPGLAARGNGARRRQGCAPGIAGIGAAGNAIHPGTRRAIPFAGGLADCHAGGGGGGHGGAPFHAAPCRYLRHAALPGHAAGAGDKPVPGGVSHRRAGRQHAGRSGRLWRALRAARVAGWPGGGRLAGERGGCRPCRGWQPACCC